MIRVIKDNRGLTLLELLVAVSVFSIVIGGLASVLSSGIRIKRRGDQYGTRMHCTVLVLDDIHRNLRNMVSGHSGSFRGDSKEMSFLARGEEWQEGERSRVIVHRLTYSSDLAEGRIVKTSALPDGRPGIPTVLARGTANLEFSYQVDTEDQGIPVWDSEWSADGPPAAVRVELIHHGAPGLAPEARWTRIVQIPGAGKPAPGERVALKGQSS